MSKKVIVFGATGNSGIAVCQELKSNNVDYVAFVREGSEGKLKELDPWINTGSVLEYSDVQEVFNKEQFTDVIITLGSRDLKGGNIRFNGTKNVVEALKSTSQKCKIHILSAHGVGNSWDRLKWYEKLISKLLIATTMADHELQEEVVRKNEVGYHIVKAVGLKDEKGTGKIIAKTEGSMPNSSISRIDVAKYIVEGVQSNASGEISICEG